MKEEAESYCVVITTEGSEEKAASIARSLVSARLAACVQVMPIRSFFMWDGAASDEAEYLVFVKTRLELYLDVQSHIAEIHSYELPEIIQLPINAGLAGYLTWITESTT